MSINNKNTKTRIQCVSFHWEKITNCLHTVFMQMLTNWELRTEKFIFDKLYSSELIYIYHKSHITCIRRYNKCSTYFVRTSLLAIRDDSGNWSHFQYQSMFLHSGKVGCDNLVLQIKREFYTLLLSLQSNSTLLLCCTCIWGESRSGSGFTQTPFLSLARKLNKPTHKLEPPLAEPWIHPSVYLEVI